jgi:uncharacterized protein YndB with AHSA1/START domain
MTDSLPVIETDDFLPHPPATVWRALTDPELLARWWVAGDIRPEVGHRFTLDMGAWGVQQCEVTAVVPERELSYSFGEGGIDTSITWTLVAEGTGTRLFLRHEGFDLDTPLGRTALAGMGRGWPGVVARIGEVLAPAH